MYCDVCAIHLPKYDMSAVCDEVYGVHVMCVLCDCDVPYMWCECDMWDMTVISYTSQNQQRL